MFDKNVPDLLTLYRIYVVSVYFDVTSSWLFQKCFINNLNRKKCFKTLPHSFLININLFFLQINLKLKRVVQPLCQVLSHHINSNK